MHSSTVAQLPTKAKRSFLQNRKLLPPLRPRQPSLHSHGPKLVLSVEVSVGCRSSRLDFSKNWQVPRVFYGLPRVLTIVPLDKCDAEKAFSESGIEGLVSNDGNSKVTSESETETIGDANAAAQGSGGATTDEDPKLLVDAKIAEADRCRSFYIFCCTTSPSEICRCTSSQNEYATQMCCLDLCICIVKIPVLTVLRGTATKQK